MDRMPELAVELLTEQEEATLRKLQRAIAKISQCYRRWIIRSFDLAGVFLVIPLLLWASALPEMDFWPFVFVLASSVLASATLLEFVWFGRRRRFFTAELERLAESQYAQAGMRKFSNVAIALHAFDRIDALGRGLRRPSLLLRRRMRELFPNGNGEI